MKICVFSGKRGGFGAYLRLMQLIEKDPAFKLQIMLGDMHTADVFGETVDEARAYFPHARIDLIKTEAGRDDTPLTRARTLGQTCMKAATILARAKPDIVFVHGDRGEHLAVAMAALHMNIPIAHTQGGEVSGNVDGIVRHSITKLAHLHFVETAAAAKRVAALGEEKWRIHNVGSLYIDRIYRKMYTPNAKARASVGLGPRDQYFVCIIHPETRLTRRQNYAQAKKILKAIHAYGDSRVILTYPCSDPGYEGVLKVIRELARPPQFLVFKNIDNLDFLGLLEGASLTIGNSSMAFVEAPYFKLGAINIGSRETDREREANVLDVKPDTKKIMAAMNFALTDRKYRAQLKKCGHLRGDGRASELVLKIIKKIQLGETLFQKPAPQ